MQSLSKTRFKKASQHNLEDQFISYIKINKNTNLSSSFQAMSEFYRLKRRGGTNKKGIG